MARRGYTIDDKRAARFEKEGRGQGVGEDYKPWLTIRDVPSRGRSHRLVGMTTSRVHHFLSDIEHDLFLLLDWQDSVIDLREQVPLKLDETSRIANRHALGVLVIDEIQHLTLAKGVGPEALLNFLVTLINTIGIPVVMIGTLGALPVLQGDFRQARRANGLGSAIWERLSPGPIWDHFVESLWRYQWTREDSPLTDEIRQILYLESQGIIDVLVKLFMLAQLRVMELRLVRKRPETLDAGLIRQVSAEHFKVISPMMAALKTGDRRKIAQYDDLRPLEDHVQQVLSSSQLRLSVASASSAAAPSVSVAAAVDPLSGALRGLGLANDLAEHLAGAAKVACPNGSLIDQVAHVASAPASRLPRTGRASRAACRRDGPWPAAGSTSRRRQRRRKPSLGWAAISPRSSGNGASARRSTATA